VRARIEQDARACASVVAVDLTSFEGDHVAWFACVNRLITELASGGEEYLVEMLEDRRFVIFMPGAWEGEAVKLVRTLRTALWRYMPAFSVAPVTVSVGIAEVIGSVLAKAHRASTGSASVDFGGQTAPASKLMPMAA
jgi:hypothetical protein